MKTTSPLPWQQGHSNKRVIYTCEESGPVQVASFDRQKDLVAVVKVMNQLPDLLALRDAVAAFIKLGAISQQDYTALAAAYEKVK